MNNESNPPSTQTPGTKIDWDNPRDEVYFTEGIRLPNPNDPTLKLYLLSKEEIDYLRRTVELYDRGTLSYKRWGRIQEDLIGKGILLDSSRPVIFQRKKDEYSFTFTRDEYLTIKSAIELFFSGARAAIDKRVYLTKYVGVTYSQIIEAFQRKKLIKLFPPESKYKPYEKR